MGLYIVCDRQPAPSAPEGEKGPKQPWDRDPTPRNHDPTTGKRDPTPGNRHPTAGKSHPRGGDQAPTLREGPSPVGNRVPAGWDGAPTAGFPSGAHYASAKRRAAAFHTMPVVSLQLSGVFFASLTALPPGPRNCDQSAAETCVERQAMRIVSAESGRRDLISWREAVRRKAKLAGRLCRQSAAFPRLTVWLQSCRAQPQPRVLQ